MILVGSYRFSANSDLERSTCIMNSNVARKVMQTREHFQKSPIAPVDVVCNLTSAFLCAIARRGVLVQFCFATKCVEAVHKVRCVGSKPGYFGLEILVWEFWSVDRGLRDRPLIESREESDERKRNISRYSAVNNDDASFPYRTAPFRFAGWYDCGPSGDDGYINEPSTKKSSSIVVVMEAARWQR